MTREAIDSRNAKIRAVWTPEKRAKHAARWTQERIAAVSEAQIARFAEPAFKARHAAIMKAIWTPEKKAKHWKKKK